MQWNVVYRKDINGVWRAVAFFLFHHDGERYKDTQNLLEPGRYKSQLERFERVV